MGIVKIYNVLGGFYRYYNSMVPDISVHKLTKICEILLCNMRKRLHSSSFVVFMKHTTAKKEIIHTLVKKIQVHANLLHVPVPVLWFTYQTRCVALLY